MTSPSDFYNISPSETSSVLDLPERQVWKHDRGEDWVKCCKNYQGAKSTANKFAYIFSSVIFDIFINFSIITIDFFVQVCYTQIKLENKTNILTNKITTQKQKGASMAANKNKISTFNLPDGDKVVDSEWRDDIDVDYAIYGDDEKQEGEYVSPEKVSRESIKEIKSFQEKLAFRSLKKFRQKEQRKLAVMA